MVQNGPPLTSPDGSSNGNPPERCPHPLYSQDSTQEHQEIPQEDQVDGSSNGNPPERCPRPLYSRDSTQEHQEILQEDQGEDLIVVKVEDDEMLLTDDETCKWNETPPEISTDPRDTERDIKAEEEEGCMKIKEEEIPIEISLEGSSNGNPPERCPRPLYSRDSTQEGHTIPHHHQVDGSSNGNPPQRCPHPLYSRDSTQEGQTIPHHHQVDGSSNRNPPERCPQYAQASTPEDHEVPHQEDHEIPHQHQGEEGVITIKAEVYDDDDEVLSVRGDESCKEEEVPPGISTDVSNSPERFLRPLHSQYTTQEHQNIPHDDLFENDVEDEVYMTTYQQCKEEECPIEINADGREVRKTLNRHLTLSPYWDRQEDNITEVSPREDQASLPVYPVLNRSPTPSNLQESSADTSLILIPSSNLGLPGADWPPDPADLQETGYHKALKGNKLHLCSFCGKQFTTHANVVRHVRTHTGDRPYSCSICGKSFTQKSILLNHQKVHTGDRPFPCPDCGKCFAKSSDVVRHRRVHTGERPYLCLECGKSFTQKFRLRNHQHFHNEDKLPLRGLADKSNQFR